MLEATRGSAGVSGEIGDPGRDRSFRTISKFTQVAAVSLERCLYYWASGLEAGCRTSNIGVSDAAVHRLLQGVWSLSWSRGPQELVNVVDVEPGQRHSGCSRL